jgi:hypothetical protein
MENGEERIQKGAKERKGVLYTPPPNLRNDNVGGDNAMPAATTTWVDALMFVKRQRRVRE